MQKYIEVTGKTEDEALTKGLQQLGLDRDDVSVEILERGKTGFLGIGSVPAKVKITYEAPDEPEGKEVKANELIQEEKPAQGESCAPAPPGSASGTQGRATKTGVRLSACAYDCGG